MTGKRGKQSPPCSVQALPSFFFGFGGNKRALGTLLGRFSEQLAAFTAAAVYYALS